MAAGAGLLSCTNRPGEISKETEDAVGRAGPGLGLLVQYRGEKHAHAVSMDTVLCLVSTAGRASRDSPTPATLL